MFEENEKNPNWHGDDTTHSGGFHDWIRKRKIRPRNCENCGEQKPLELSNISGKYIRSPHDFEWLCRKCHMVRDGRINRRKKDGKFERFSLYQFGINQ